MTEKGKLLVSLFAVLLLGCATPSQSLNKVNIGMTKAEVISALGQPESTRANKGTEYLIYTMNNGWGSPILFSEYFVKLVNGKVESYGRVGDFDSTKPFETKHEVDLNVKEK
jgi:starvation-inducible outer membrane lipoprotein